METEVEEPPDNITIETTFECLSRMIKIEAKETVKPISMISYLINMLSSIGNKHPTNIGQNLKHSQKEKLFCGRK